MHCRSTTSYSFSHNPAHYLLTMPRRPVQPSEPTSDSIDSSTSTSHSAAANALISARVVGSTQKGYQNCLRVIRDFYTSQLHRSRGFVLPVKQQDILQFFGWLTETRFKDKPAAMSTIRAYKSALLWHYGEERKIIDPVINLAIESVLKGYQRKVANLKAEGKMPVFEGKYHLPYDGYCIIAKALLHTEPHNRMLFGWPFLLLQWNLIARSATVSGIMMEHVSWEGDALLVSTPKSKADQEGARVFSRHVYANPAHPTICPVLALAVLIFTRVLRHDPTQPTDRPAPPSFRIFDGAYSEARFCEVLHAVIGSLPAADLTRLGGEKKQLGTHSIRKGAATYCTGMISGPSTAQVFLRAGWSLGNVQDRYLFAGAGGDQLTGRVVAGLPFNDPTFTCLPPHFTSEGLLLIPWMTVLPLYSRLPETFKRALPYLLASICYHEQWLRSTLPPAHPLFSTYLFSSGQVDVLKQFVIAGRSRCPLTGMLATGISPHLILSNELTDVAKQTEQLKTALLEQCARLPEQLTTTMLQRFAINGAIPLTADDMRTMMSQFTAQLRSEFQQLASNAAAPLTASFSRTLTDFDDADSDPRFTTWLWKGRLHPVPEGWKFPSTDVKATWNLWHFGHLGDRIRPLRYLRKHDLNGTTVQIALWSKTSGVMQEIAHVMVELDMAHTTAEVRTWQPEESAVAFDEAIVRLIEKLKAGATRTKGRWMEMQIPTLYNHTAPLRRERKRKRKRPQDGDEGDAQQSAAVDDEISGSMAAAAVEVSEMSVE